MAIRSMTKKFLASQPGGMALGAANRLELLARAYGGIDKLDHGYLPYYSRHFGPLRLRRNTVLEIGIGSHDGYDAPTPGGSLRMWRDYFSRSTVAALDITPKVVSFGPRVRVFQADQSSVADLERVLGELGPLDMVIDDGSHVGAHQITSFETLFPHVRAGGWYVVEDLSTSYWPTHDGAIPAPAGSGVGLAKELVDSVQARDPIFGHGRDWGPVPVPRYTDVAEVHAYPGIVFVRRA